MSIFKKTTDVKDPVCLSTIWVNFGIWTTPILILSCSFSPAPASSLPLPYFRPAPCKLLSCTFLAPPQFLPSSCPLSALLCFTLLSSTPALFLPCSCPAHASAPLLLCSCPAPALLLVLPTLVWQLSSSSSSSAPYDFFGTARAAFYIGRWKDGSMERLESRSMGSCEFIADCLNSQYKYSHETFSYKDDSRGGEYLINRLLFIPKSIP